MTTQNECTPEKARMLQEAHNIVSKQRALTYLEAALTYLEATNQTNPVRELLEDMLKFPCHQISDRDAYSITVTGPWLSRLQLILDTLQ